MTKTKERPIILNAQEVLAVLAGDKTQHRVLALTNDQIIAGYEWDFSADGDAAIFYKYAGDGISIEETLLIECPFGAIGDRLWVQEDHARYNIEDGQTSLCSPHYFADGPLTLDLRHDAGLLNRFSAKNMYRSISRLLLEITDIRIERVQDISEIEAISEGVEAIPKYADCNGPNNFTVDCGSYQFNQPTAKACYAYLHYLRHGDESWDRNDWVWGIEFKVIKETSNG